MGELSQKLSTVQWSFLYKSSLFVFKVQFRSFSAYCKSSFTPEHNVMVNKHTNAVLWKYWLLWLCSWCDHTSAHVEIKCQLDATEVFIADLIACSTYFGHHYAHHQELKSSIQWLLPVVFRAVVFKLLVWCRDEGYVSGLQDAALKQHPANRTYNPHLHTRPATWKPQHEIPQAATTVYYSWAPDVGHSGARNMLSKQ